MKSELRQSSRRAQQSGLLMLCSLLAATAAHSATEMEATVSVGITHTNNIEKTATAPRDSNVPEVGLLLRLENRGPRLRVTVDSGLTYSAFEKKLYQSSSTPNGVTGAAGLAIIGDIIPERFSWEFHDTLGTSSIQFVAPDTPSNRQLANVISTGPNIEIPLGARGQFTAEGELFRTDYGNDTANNRGYRTSAGLLRRVSRSLSVSVRASRSSIEYTQFLSLGNFNVTSGSVLAEYRGARTDASLEAGKTKLDSLLSNDSSPLFRVTMRRALTARSSFSLRLGREYSNSASTLQTNFDFYGVASTLHGGTAVAEAFRADYGQLSWTYDSGVYDINLQALGRRETYPSGNLEPSRLYSGAAFLGRNFGRVRFGLRGQYERRDISGISRKSDERTYGADLTWRTGRALAVTLGAEHSSGTSLDLSRDYSETREFLRVGYTIKR